MILKRRYAKTKSRYNLHEKIFFSKFVKKKKVGDRKSIERIGHDAQMEFSRNKPYGHGTRLSQ